MAENGVLGAPRTSGVRPALVGGPHERAGRDRRPHDRAVHGADSEDRASTLESAKSFVEKDKVFAMVAVNTRSIGGASLYLEEQGIPVLGFPIGDTFKRFSHF